jgi:hypothetical protein
MYSVMVRPPKRRRMSEDLDQTLLVMDEKKMSTTP